MIESAQRDPRIIEADRLIKAANAERDKIVEKVRAECLHDVVAEAPYRQGSFFPTLPPFRVCHRCGLEEDGWGTGYHVLKDRPGRLVTHVDRDKGYAMRVFPQPKENA